MYQGVKWRKSNGTFRSSSKTAFSQNVSRQRNSRFYKKELLDFINQCNQTSGLNIQLILDEPKAFDNFMAHYGKFSGVKNYLALIGKKSVKLEEMCGYYGEKIVLKAHHRQSQRHF